jgi:hypothetical protein
LADRDFPGERYHRLATASAGVREARLCFPKKKLAVFVDGPPSHEALAR